MFHVEGLIYAAESRLDRAADAFLRAHAVSIETGQWLTALNAAAELAALDRSERDAAVALTCVAREQLVDASDVASVRAFDDRWGTG